MIKHKWAFVIGVFFIISSIRRFLSGTLTSSAYPIEYNFGTVLSAILLPTVFLIVAFLPEKKK